MRINTSGRMMLARLGLMAGLIAAGTLTLMSFGGGEPHGGAQAASEASAEKSAAVMRIGTVSRMDVLVLYTKSSIHEANIRDLRSQLEEAKAAGDTKRAKEIEKKGGELQEQRHRQLAAQEGLDDIIKDTEDIWKDIAKEAGVQAVVIDAVMFKGVGVEVVDVTPLLEKRLKKQ